MNFITLQNESKQNLMIAISGFLLLVLSFAVLEPAISLAQTSTFSVRQQVTSEVSFSTSAANVTMAGSLAGLTGGNATGTTLVAVQTNSATGYNMTIAFTNNPAMRGETTGSTAIGNYGTTTEPTFNFFASTSAVFAYSVYASTTADLDQSFKSNGSACNTGAASTANTCWMGASTTAFQIIARTTAATTTPATTTVQFRVNIPNNPTPAVQSDFYTATATLTVTAT